VGRHSSPRQWRYYTSILRYALPWILLTVVGVSAVWAGVGALGDDELDPTKGPVVSEAEDPGSRAEPSAEATPVEPEETPDGGDEETEDRQPSLITEGMSVQVLNGTNVTGADQAMAGRLQELGYQVVNVVPASISYAETTVLWSYAESEEAAVRLAERFGWQVKPKPDNLSTQVALHVVVGADET
jgi:LytR cell envelope-related transcriptional attenuator